MVAEAGTPGRQGKKCVARLVTTKAGKSLAAYYWNAGNSFLAGFLWG
jgi:hypothetical protein